MASIKPIVTRSKDFIRRRRGQNSRKASNDAQSGEEPNSNEIEEYLAAGVDDIEERQNHAELIFLTSDQNMNSPLEISQLEDDKPQVEGQEHYESHQNIEDTPIGTAGNQHSINYDMN